MYILNFFNKYIERKLNIKQTFFTMVKVKSSLPCIIKYIYIKISHTFHLEIDGEE